MSEYINDPDAAFHRTWNEWFGPRKVKLNRGTNPELFYYKPESKFWQNSNVAGYLTQQKTGSCVAWLRLLWIVTGRLNECLCQKTRVRPIPPYRSFLVKRWVDGRVEDWGWNTWWFSFGGTKPDMADPFPSPSQLIYGQVENDTSGELGQNDLCPSQKVFGEHWLFHLLSDDKYYDPGYGKVYDSQEQFENGLFALTKENPQGQIALNTEDLTLELDNQHPHPWVEFKDFDFNPGEDH